jgi:hypothetical protein
MADGNVDAAELQALSVFAKRLSVPEEIFQKLANTAKQMADDRRQS